MAGDFFYTPRIESPYPGEFGVIDQFNYQSHLYLGRKREKVQHGRKSEVNYVVLRDYRVSFRVDGRATALVVPAGMLTDLASVPRIARSFVGRVGPHLEASIVHDFLYIAWQILPGGQPRDVDWRFANEVMYAGLRATRMARCKQWAIRRALNNFSYGVYAGREDDSDKLFLDPERDALFVSEPPPAAQPGPPAENGAPDTSPTA